MNLVSFSDVFKNGFLENFKDLSLGQGLLIMLVALLTGVFICVVYRITYRGVLFSRSFCFSLLAMDMITSLIILTVTSNIVLSLGMVGALSIVRFRTAIKEPMDIAFLYLSICAGIMTGANLLLMSIIGVGFVGIVLVVISRLPVSSDAYIVMITANADDEDTIYKYVKKSTKRAQLKSKTLTGQTAELAIEVVLAGGQTAFLNKLNSYPSVAQISIVKSSGEYI